MHLCLAAVLAVLSFLVAASPIAGAGSVIHLTKRKSLAKDGVVDIGALNAHRAHAQAKVNRGFENLKLNTGADHPADKRAHRRATGSVPLSGDSVQGLWYGNIQIGSPASTFTVDFDTGSSDLFLPGTRCIDANCRGRKIYNTSASSTARDAGRSFSLAFGGGSTVSGEQFTDTVTVAGLTATGQRVGAATTYSPGLALNRFSPDGLMGMAFPKISGFRADPVFQTLVAQGKTTQSVFGFTLRTSGSELFLGGTDTSKFSGTMTFTPVTRVGFWEITLGGATVGGMSVAGAKDAIVDTGTTLVIGDTTSVKAIYAAIPGSKDAPHTVGSGFFTVPCASVPNNVGLTLGGRTFTISAATFNLGQLSPGSADCVGGIIGDNSVGFWIIGDVFLQNVYTSFDVGNQRVGFATLK